MWTRSSSSKSGTHLTWKHVATGKDKEGISSEGAQEVKPSKRNPEAAVNDVPT